jgi:hypothetical protein
VKRLWQFLKDLWAWGEAKVLEVVAAVKEMATRKPTKPEFLILQRIIPALPAAVITGFFFMAASLNALAAMIVGIVLIGLSLVAFKWATQEGVEIS